MRSLRPSAKKSCWIGNGDVGFTKVEDGHALGDGEGGEVVNFFFVILTVTGMGRRVKCRVETGGTGSGTGISSVDSVGTVVSYRKNDFR